MYTFAISPISSVRSLLCRRTAKILTRLCECAGWSGSSLVAYILGSLFSTADLVYVIILDTNDIKISIFCISPHKTDITKTRLFKYVLRILPPKNENFQVKNSDIFLISAQNIDCRYSLEPPRWGGSNEYPQSMFLSRNKKNNVYPCKPQFYYMKVGFMGIKII